VRVLEKILNLIGLKIIRPMKHESKMTNEELMYVAEWSEKIGFYHLAKIFITELEKRGLIKKE
jgi:hypothetical protein